MTPAYRYSAQCVRVIDGDTFVAAVDLGFSVFFKAHLRLEGFSAPELRDPCGVHAKNDLEALIVGQKLIVETSKQSFERFVAKVWVERDGQWVNVSEELGDEQEERWKEGRT